MKVDVTIKLFNLKGEPLETQVRVKQEDETYKVEAVHATLGSICSDALLSVLPGDEKVSGKIKYDNWQLAKLLLNSGKAEVNVTAEQIVTIKDRIAKSFGTVVVGPVYALLEKD